MKLRLLMATALAFSPVAIAPTAATENTHESIQFGLAGWATIDEETGEEHSRMLQTSGLPGEEVLIGFGGSDVYRAACPGGGRADAFVDRNGEGTGTLRVTRNLDAATLVGTVDVEIFTSILCDPVVVEHTRRLDVPVGFDLVGYGPRRTEAEGGTRHLVPEFNVHWRGRAVARDARGTFSVGGNSYPLDYGDFGRVKSSSHAAVHDDGSPLSTTALVMNRVTSATEGGRITEVGGIWEEFSGDDYDGVYVGADQVHGETPIVFLSGYRSVFKKVDGATALVTTIRRGEGPGTLEVVGHNKSATVSGSVDIETTVLNETEGTIRSWIDHDVTIEARLVGNKLVLHSTDWSAVRIPGVSNERARVSWVGRDAAGLLRVGSDLYEPTTWGEIGTFRWKEHFQYH